MIKKKKKPGARNRSKLPHHSISKNAYFFMFFLANPTAYGNSQDRGRIRDTAEAYDTTRATLCHLWPTLQLMATSYP